ncbi:MAG: glycoside hydrolase family 11 protein [Oscillospiraceae bacterium]|nr:glycoside hydrolase family 11 protein [Oscillospiraceae bacterium]
MTRKLCQTLAALLLFMLALPASAAFEPVTITGTAGARRSSFNGFDYELWTQRRDDDVSMTLTGAGTYECHWNDAYNVLFRMGKRLGSVKPYEDYGDIVLEYGAEHTITGGDVSYLCVYGWTQNPLIEFYVVENYGRYKPPGGKGFQGQIEVDGGLYDVYADTRVEQPSIEGTKTFQQYFSVRVDRRTEGTISLTEHFKAWEAMGLDMGGNLYEVALCIEGFHSSGSANIYNHILTIGDTEVGPDETPPSPSPQPAPSPSPAEEPSPSPDNPSPPPGGGESGFPVWLVIGVSAVLGLAIGLAVMKIMTKKR